MGEPVFAIGTGRCGTKFLYTVLAREPQVASHHERHPLSDTFHRYCKWYNLPVDHAGFLDTKKRSIETDLTKKHFSFEASAFLSLSVEELYKEFNAKFILLVRSPDKVINSYIRKGWYENQIILSDPEKAPSYQQSKEFHHFLGRTIPKGDEFLRWNGLSRVGKLAWFWNVLNKEVLRQAAVLPSSHFLVMRLEDLNFEKYKNVIAPFIGFEPSVSPADFTSLEEEKPNSFNNVRKVSSWNHQEREEFLYEVKETATFFGYDTGAILSNLTETADGTVIKRHHQKRKKRSGGLWKFILNKFTS